MLSPFFLDDVLTSRLRTSAPKRFPAKSNEARVRVLGSKNRFAIVRPRKALDRTGGLPISDKNNCALSRSSVIWRRSRPRIVSKCRRRPSLVHCSSASSTTFFVSKSSVTDMAAEFYSDSRFVAGYFLLSHLSAINAAAALSIISFLIRPRSPWARPVFNNSLASSDEYRSSSVSTGSPKRPSSSIKPVT